MKSWNLYAEGEHVCTVSEETEELARCTALSKYGISAQEFEAQEAAGSTVKGIPPKWVFM